MWHNLGETLASTTRLQLCGRLAIECDGVRVEARLPGRQGALLLGYLGTHLDRSVLRDELVHAVWGDAAPPDADGALSSVLSKVRRVVGPDRLEGRSSIRFVDDDTVSVDVHQAVDALHRAETGVARGDFWDAWQPAHTAYAIAGRTFMLGHEADWIEEWRHRLDEVSARGLECHAACVLEVGDTPSEAERIARRLVDLSPFRETGYRLLMLALERSGNRAEALLVFDRLRTLLSEELGTAPGPEVAAVHARLLGASS